MRWRSRSNVQAHAQADGHRDVQGQQADLRYGTQEEEGDEKARGRGYGERNPRRWSEQDGPDHAQRHRQASAGTAPQPEDHTADHPNYLDGANQADFDPDSQCQGSQGKTPVDRSAIVRFRLQPPTNGEAGLLRGCASRGFMRRMLRRMLEALRSIRRASSAFEMPRSIRS